MRNPVMVMMANTAGVSTGGFKQIVPVGIRRLCQRLTTASAAFATHTQSRPQTRSESRRNGRGLCVLAAVPGDSGHHHHRRALPAAREEGSESLGPPHAAALVRTCVAVYICVDGSHDDSLMTVSVLYQ